MHRYQVPWERPVTSTTLLVVGCRLGALLLFAVALPGPAALDVRQSRSRARRFGVCRSAVLGRNDSVVSRRIRSEGW